MLVFILILLIYIVYLAIKENKLIKNLTWIIIIIAFLLLTLRFFHPILAFLTSTSIILLASFNKIMNLLFHFEAFKKIYKKNTTNKQNCEENLSINEAAKILGITINASEAEINAAFRKLIKKHHPDHGGSADFANKLTQARELLLQWRKK